MPPPIWKKPIEDAGAVRWYQPASAIMYSTPDFIVWTDLNLPLIACAAKTLPSVESSQPGTKIGRSASLAASSQLLRGSIS